ncbi:flagellar assembly protein FliX [mine drainage metagenome]|uniref:Flagellar assembly protein FliX n=1 Tax=mine drainage metagenome TaxID=410659 RepID=A0A1J5RN20_9ZZZZ
MKISGYGPTSGTGQAKRTGKTDKTSSSAFAQHLASPAEEPVEEALGLEATVTVGNIDALLAVQAADDSTEREQRRRLIQRGEDILDKLEDVRHGLLIGAIPKDKLVALAQLVRTRRDTVGDPRLAAVLDEIELRAEVELAKLAARADSET